jgi:predicted PurR-regulated permease PerM
MNQDDNHAQGTAELKRSIEIFIRVGLILLLLLWAFQIIKPFIDLLAWSAILAIALYPVCQFVARRMGGKMGRASIVLTLLLITLIVLPTVQLVISSVDSAKEVAAELQAGTLKIPSPSEKIRSLPLFGEEIYATWEEASQNLESTARKFEREIKLAGEKLLGVIGGTGLTILKFSFAIIIAGAFMAKAPACHDFTLRLSERLVGKEGEHYVDLARATIRSVAQGILGIAAFQAIAAAAGMAFMDIPLAGIWSLGVLMLAIVQLPPLLVLGPVAAYAFSVHDTVSASIFAVYCVVVSMSDSFLKPLLLGRGVDVPMLVILLGAIGGMIVSGIIGLFVGAVVLALAYQLFTEWLNQKSRQEETAPESAT